MATASYPVPFTIGQSPDNQIVLNKPTISRHHARLTLENANTLLLEDTLSKHGTFLVEYGTTTKIRVKRRYVGRDDTVYFAEHPYVLEQLLPTPYQLATLVAEAAKQDIIARFSALRSLPDEYKARRRRAKDIEKQVRLGSVLVATAIAILAVTLGKEFTWLTVLSSAGIGILVPTLASSLLGTEDKLERLDTEFKEAYRCPNKLACKYRFGNQPWEELADLKKCPKCKATWVA